MNEKLPKMRACPFDGGTGALEEIENMEIGFGFPFWCVTCKKCGASGPVSDAAIGTRQKDAIEKWNGRMK